MTQPPLGALALLRSWLLLSWCSVSVLVVSAQRYNEIQHRVIEKVDNFMNAPIVALSMMNQLYDLGGFPNRLEALDRDMVVEYLYSKILALEDTGIRLYYGMESGLFLGYTSSAHGVVPSLSYREPGESGYNPNDPRMRHYLQACVHQETGDEEPCLMQEGKNYVSCNDDCELVKCNDSTPDDDCSILVGTLNKECERETRWCKNYTIEQVPPDKKMGFIPRSFSCLNCKGMFTETPGEVVLEVFDETTNSVSVQFGNCTFKSGESVSRQRPYGPFAYCGSKCNTTFTGVYRSQDYDPRFRGWYIDVKEAQHARWSDPYVFSGTGEIGITFADPIYKTDELGRSVFMGVLAADYLLVSISEFLVRTYNGTDVTVAIYEDAEPHYVIGTSTGSSVTAQVLTEDPTQPCSEEQAANGECKTIRLAVTNLGSSEGALIIKNGHLSFTDIGHNSDQLVSVKASVEDIINSQAYSVSSLVHEQRDYNLKWRIMVLTKMPRDSHGTIVRGGGLFPTLIVISVVGFLLCFTLFVLFYKNRNEPAVKFADIIFTSAFLWGCALQNLGNLTLLGENTNGMCLLRMWTFYMLFAMVISPLFVKAYRTWKLLGAFDRKKMNNLQAWLRTLPIMALQFVVLMFFTFFDPPRTTEEIDVDESIPTQKIFCAHDSQAFTITQSAINFLLISVGCVLAYKTRNIDPKIGDSKALLFAMYNIAFTAIMYACIISVVDLSAQGRAVMTAVGVFWASVFSSTACAVPRLMQAYTERQTKRMRMTEARCSFYTKSQAINSNRGTNGASVDLALDILVCSANLGNAEPTPSSLAAWIPPCGSTGTVKTLDGNPLQSNRFDIIVIGMQEATWSNESTERSTERGETINNYKTTKKSSRKAAAIAAEDDDDDAETNYLAAVEGECTVALRKNMTALLGEDYLPVAEESRGQMRLYIWAVKEVAPFVEDLKVTGCNTGVGNVLANKGGIVISFNYLKTRISFLSAHLAAHEGRSYYQARCDNVHNILLNSRSAGLGKTYCGPFVASHHMFVLGDLNFRTNFDDGASHEEHVHRALDLVKAGDFNTLYSYDELHKGIEKGDLLVGFQTLPCHFNPTFKVQRGPGFVYKQQRTPSYTDRVLFKSAEGLESKLKTLAYEPCVDFITSDHKPVRCAFSIVPNEFVSPVRINSKFHLLFRNMECSNLPVGDVNGFSDPYIMFVWDGVDITQEKRKGLRRFLPKALLEHNWPRTSVKYSTLDCEWKGEEIALVSHDKVDVGADAMLFLTVMDYDWFKDDDWLGTVPLNINSLLLKLNGAKKKRITFDRRLLRNGKFTGRVKFTLDVVIE